MKLGHTATGGGAEIRDSPINLHLHFHVTVHGDDPAQRQSVISETIATIKKALGYDQSTAQIALPAQRIPEADVPRR